MPDSAHSAHIPPLSPPEANRDFHHLTPTPDAAGRQNPGCVVQSVIEIAFLLEYGSKYKYLYYKQLGYLSIKKYENL